MSCDVCYETKSIVFLLHERLKLTENHHEERAVPHFQCPLYDLLKQSFVSRH